MQHECLVLQRKQIARMKKAGQKAQQKLVEALVAKNVALAFQRQREKEDERNGLNIVRAANDALKGMPHPVGANPSVHNRMPNRYNVIVNFAMRIVSGDLPANHFTTLWIADMMHNLAYDNIVSSRYHATVKAVLAAMAVTSPAAYNILCGRTRPDAAASSRTTDMRALVAGRCFNVLGPSMSTCTATAEGIASAQAGAPRVPSARQEVGPCMQVKHGSCVAPHICGAVRMRCRAD